MRRLFPIALATAVVLASLGAVLVNGKSSTSAISVASATGTVSSEIDARRTELMRRIEEARHAGHLRGVGYMALLGEHQSLLVAQRRAEAQGMSPEAISQLNADLDRANAHLERQLQR